MKVARVRVIAGWVLHALIAALLLFAAFGKLFGSIPEEVVAQLAELNLDRKLALIGAGEAITALLLLVPWTLSLGVLVASGFWGGVILFHMVQGDGYAPGAVLLVLTWIGAYLRLPATFSSIPGAAQRPAPVDGSA
jgi:hypothetical protein